jgi:hypothetical protein
MIHDIPSSESSEYENFKVHTHNGRTKDTDWESLSSRMTVTDEQATVLSVNFYFS